MTPTTTAEERAAVEAAIPHRSPFLFVDRVIELVGYQRAVGLKNVSFNEPYFQGHFPSAPVMPGVMIIEALGQVGCILAMKLKSKEGAPVIYFTGIDSARFRKPVVPGDQLRLELTKQRARGFFFRFEGKAFVGEDLVAEAVLKAVLGKETDEEEQAS